MTNNGENSDQNVEDFSDPNVDEVPGDLYDKGPKEVENVHGLSFSNPSIYTKRLLTWHVRGVKYFGSTNFYYKFWL
ncbi:hypothetical protein J1N35_015162 [Gossypium stocksii]|uniref:Uncharacterized protein n=1 Tax=Gossypium stocksii TaxID=47602 RepID=A0A9D4AAG0_9ROSI|nr:hypothetical protein J1N35_015162 [Gossypium stocksii]